MKTLRLLLSFALLLFAISPAIQPALAQSPTPAKVNGPSAANGNKIYLPLLVNGQLNSFDLIDKDIASGKLTAEQGLIYKVYALFSDNQLPPAYIGSGSIPDDGELVMRDVVEQAATLSAAAKQALTPFFVPPDDPRSWYYRKHLGSSSAPQPMQTSDAGWVSISAVGGKIRVFYLSTNAADEDKATSIAAEFDSTIWSKLTTLMNQTPIPNGSGTTDIYLWNSYLKTNGTVVPFDKGTLGITIAPHCQLTSVDIYLPDYLPIGSRTSPGLIQFATHEFMHAIQFAYPLAACRPYDWLSEATATWAEDYVYPLADSEHDSAFGYFDRPSARLDDTHAMHEYGAYLLFYYLTHTIDPTAAVIRQMWENGAGTANSYQAMDDAVNQIAPAMHNYYWGGFLVANWNKAPFNKYFDTKDRLDETVVPVEGASTTQITTPSGEQITPLYGQMSTGGAIYFHLSFPDDTVRSVTVLNGLGYKLKTGPASQDPWLAGNVKDGDEAYLFDDISNNDLTGANLILLIKMAGKDGQPLYMTVPNLNTQNDGFCLDAQGKIEDMVVILSNSDFAHPDRIMQQQGIPTTIFANNIPCYQVTGTTQWTWGDTGFSETQETDATVIYQNNNLPPDNIQQIIPIHVFPDIQLRQVSAQVNWNISGSDGFYWYAGGDHYTAGAANCTLDILQGVLAGGPSYRGYTGCGDPDEGTQITYTRYWKDKNGVTQQEPVTGGAWRFLDFDAAVDFNGKPYPVKADGSLSASGTHTYSWGGKDVWTWNLTGQKK
jgi:hypothetical protein